MHQYPTVEIPELFMLKDEPCPIETDKFLLRFEAETLFRRGAAQFAGGQESQESDTRISCLASLMKHLEDSTENLVDSSTDLSPSSADGDKSPSDSYYQNEQKIDSPLRSNTNELFSVLRKRSPVRKVRKPKQRKSKVQTLLWNGHTLHSPQSSEFKPDPNGPLASLFFSIMEEQRVTPFMLEGLSKDELHFLASVLSYLTNTSFIDVHFTSIANFVEHANSALFGLFEKEKRKDDRLRWFFKRLIRHLLIKHTPYRPTKCFRVEDYVCDLVSQFFPTHPCVKECLQKINFAGKKKLKALFTKSEAFKNAAKDFLYESLLPTHREEVTAYLMRMFLQFSSCSDKSFLADLYKASGIKNPWTPVEVSKVFQQVRHLLENLGGKP